MECCIDFQFEIPNKNTFKWDDQTDGTICRSRFHSTVRWIANIKEQEWDDQFEQLLTKLKKCLSIANKQHNEIQTYEQ